MKRREILKWTAPVITTCVLPAHAQTSAPFEPPAPPGPPQGSPPLDCEDRIRLARDNYQQISADPDATQQEVDNAFQAWIESKQCREEAVALCDEPSGGLSLSKAPTNQGGNIDSCLNVKS